MFSMVCSASAYDAAWYQKDPLTWHQRYVMIAPAIVAVIATILFLLCLKRQSYAIVAKFWVGGIPSILCFTLWLADLIMTMHGEDSWAVNGIGEIKAANLYYFTWASIVTAGLQMMSYVKMLLGKTAAEDTITLVWGVMAKVSFVAFGAATHVWYNISTSCKDESMEGTSIPFCRRTMFALIVGFVGTGIGSLFLGVRFFNLVNAASEGYNRFQFISSGFLVLMFILAVALITGIGGPGQSVGDLYYSTWLGFCVSISILVESYRELNRLEENGGIESDTMMMVQHHGQLYKEFYDG